jgi:hypothetical protein
MDIFPMSGVLRGFILSTYAQYADKINPCSALLIKKISQLKTENTVFTNYFFNAERMEVESEQVKSLGY